MLSIFPARRSLAGFSAITLMTGCALGGNSAAAPADNPSALSVSQRVEHLDALTREPMVVEHPRGTLFVTGYGSPTPTLWQSTDGGASWSRVSVGGEAEGAIGNSDVDLAVAADGTLYFLTMLYDRTVAEGRQITIGVSHDVGATWSWKTLSKVRFDDRPWVDVAPDGTAHIIWNDGSGVSHVMTRDRGATWSTRIRIHEQGGSSHLAVGPKGEVAVRITPASASGRKFDAGVDLIAISLDRGASWKKQPAPGQREWAPFGAPVATDRWVEPLAWDEAGRLYSLWADTTGLHLARSSDRATTWQIWQIARARGSFFPYLIARGRGELAATWFTATDPGRADLSWHAALIDASDPGRTPIVMRSSPQQQDAWRRMSAQGAAARDPAGEYVGVTFLRAGGIGIATTIQNQAENRLGFTWWRLQPK